MPQRSQGFITHFVPTLWRSPQAITKAGYTQPTAIQAQALPAALSGRDVLVSTQRARQAELCLFASDMLRIAQLTSGNVCGA